MDKPLTEGKMKSQSKQHDPDAPAPIAPPPAPTGIDKLTEKKTQQLIGNGMRVEGNLLRGKLTDELALVHMGRVVWFTQEELNQIIESKNSY